jgi:hypothetical protein
MTRQLLYRDEIHPSIEEIRTERPSKIMRRERLQTRHQGSFLEEPPDRVRVQETQM